MQERGTKVKTHTAVSIEDADDLTRIIADTSTSIGVIAFVKDAGIPIVGGGSGGFALNTLKPRILSRGLIKMSVNTKISRHPSSQYDIEQGIV
jgi:hypothetical protein